MTFTPIGAGTLNWDVPLNAALTDIQSQITTLTNVTATGDWSPMDQGLIAWTLDPAVASGSTGPTGGVLNLCKISVAQQALVTNVNLGVTAAISGGVSGQNFVGIYDMTGTLLMQSADLTVALGTGNNPLTVPMTSPSNLAAGFYWLAMLFNATTTPTISRGSAGASATINVGTTAVARRFATFGSGLTSLPGTFSPASITAGTVSYILSIS